MQLVNLHGADKEDMDEIEIKKWIRDCTWRQVNRRFVHTREEVDRRLVHETNRRTG